MSSKLIICLLAFTFLSCGVKKKPIAPTNSFIKSIPDLHMIKEKKDQIKKEEKAN